MRSEFVKHGAARLPALLPSDSVLLNAGFVLFDLKLKSQASIPPMLEMGVAGNM